MHSYSKHVKGIDFIVRFFFSIFGDTYKTFLAIFKADLLPLLFGVGTRGVQIQRVA